MKKEFNSIYSSLSHAKTPTFWLAPNLIFPHIIRGFPKPTTASQDLLGFYSGVYVRILNTVQNLRLNSTYLIQQFPNQNNHSCDKGGFKCGLQVPRRGPTAAWQEGKIPSPDAWPGVLDHVLDIRRLLMCREWCTGPSPVSSPGDAVTRERRRGCRMSRGYRIQRQASWEKSPVRCQPGGRQCK